MFKKQINQFSNWKNSHGNNFKAVQLSQNRTYAIFFTLWNQKGCREVMSLFLSKKVKKIFVYWRQKFIIFTSYILEVISQPPLWHYMDPASYDFTNNFEKNAFVSGAFNAFTNNKGRWLGMLYMESLVAKQPVLPRYQKDGNTAKCSTDITLNIWLYLSFDPFSFSKYKTC